MSEKRVAKVAHRTAGPIHDLPWLRRKLAVRSARTMLRRVPVEGLLGLDRDGRPIWADGCPEALNQR